MLKQEGYGQHISGQFNAELESLRNQLLAMGGQVEQQLTTALDALMKLDSGVAESIVRNDAEINQMEMTIDDECATIIARRQPTASDLRLVITIIKVNRDLERIGDEAAKVARQAVQLSEGGMSPSSFVEIRHIGALVGVLLRQSLDAFARLDVTKAIEVVRGDAEVDKEYGSAMRSLERIGDHACNIAEHVVYLVKGLDVRHGRLSELGEEALDI